MSDANRVALRYVKETVFGTTPVSPAFQDLRFNSSSLGYTPNTITSEEIRSDRQISDLALVGFEASGNTSHELSFDAFHELLSAAFFNDWSLKPVVENAASDTPISDVTTTTITVGAVATSFKAGMLIKTSGFTTSGNNKVARLTADGAANAIVMPASTYTVEAGAIPVGARVKVVGFQGAAGDLDAAVSPNRITSTALDFTTLGISPGDWIKIGGTAGTDKFTAAGSNGWARVSIVAATALTLDVVPALWGVSAETTTTLKVFFGDKLVNGIIEKSYSIEIEYAGMPVTEYEYFVGMEASTLDFNADTQAIMGMEFGFMGFNASATGTRFAGATTVAAPANAVMNTSSNVGLIREGGVEVATPNYVMSMSLSIDNSLRMQNAIGQAGAIGIGVGRINVSGELQTYFGSTALLAKLRNNTATSFDFRINDPAGSKAYVFDMPRVKFMSGSPDVEGIDTDIMLNLGFQAIRDPTLGYTIALGRFEYFE